MNSQNEKNYLIHYGNENSGRYPRGSGEHPYQHIKNSFKNIRSIEVKTGMDIPFNKEVDHVIKKGHIFERVYTDRNKKVSDTRSKRLYVSDNAEDYLNDYYISVNHPEKTRVAIYKSTKDMKFAGNAAIKKILKEIGGKSLLKKMNSADDDFLFDDKVDRFKIAEKFINKALEKGYSGVRDPVDDLGLSINDTPKIIFDKKAIKKIKDLSAWTEFDNSEYDDWVHSKYSKMVNQTLSHSYIFNNRRLKMQNKPYNISFDTNYLEHIGNKNSGRYPRGSGENPHQHDGLKNKPLKRGAAIGAATAGIPAAIGGGLLGASVLEGLADMSMKFVGEGGYTTGAMVSAILAGAGITGIPVAAIGATVGLAGGAIVKHIMSKKKG